MRVYTTDEFMKNSKRLHIFKGSVPNHADRSDMPHTHEFIEIVYILSGKMTHVIDEVPYEVSRGDILFMNRGCTHMFECDGDFSYINILFSPEVMSEDIVTPENAFSVLCMTAFDEMRSSSDFGSISFFGAERSEIENIVLSMLYEYENKPTAWETVVGNYLHTLIIKMLRKNELKMTGVEIGNVWHELSEYIDKNLGSELTLSALAKKCFYNPSYFSRVFKEKFGVSLVEYVTKKRLDYAVKLLSETDMSVDEICAAVGFSDRSSLYHAFSRYLGQTPSDLRKSKKIKN